MASGFDILVTNVLGKLGKMDKATKLTTVRFVRDELAKLDWQDHSLHLETFGFPSPDRDMSIQDCLILGDESALQELASYLRGELGVSDPSSKGREPGRLQVFASHLTKSKIFVADFGQQLKALGIDLFVAHESIVATKHWAIEIEANLRTCHAGIVFLEADSIKSQWCDQEVGWLLGRGVPVPTLKLDGTDPYGPLGQRQAIQAAGKHASILVDQVVDVFRSEAALAPYMTESLTQAIMNSYSWDNTRRVWKFLQHYRELTPDQIQRIEKAIPENGQLQAAAIRDDAGTWTPFPEAFADFKQQQASHAELSDAPF